MTNEVRPTIVVNTRETESATVTGDVLDRMKVRMCEMESAMVELVT